MGKDRFTKPFELVSVEGFSYKFYESVEAATFDALNFYHLRWGWSIWKVQQDGRRKEWIVPLVEEHDEHCKETRVIKKKRSK